MDKIFKIKKKWQKFKMAATHMGVSKHTGGNIWGHQNIGRNSRWQLQIWGDPNIQGATYGVIKTYKGHPNVGCIQTYRELSKHMGAFKHTGGHPNICGHPNI